MNKEWEPDIGIFGESVPFAKNSPRSALELTDLVWLVFHEPCTLFYSGTKSSSHLGVLGGARTQFWARLVDQNPTLKIFLFLRVTDVEMLGLGWKLDFLLAPFRPQNPPSSSVNPGETMICEGQWNPVQQRPRKVGLDPNAPC